VCKDIDLNGVKFFVSIEGTRLSAFALSAAPVIQQRSRLLIS